MFELEKMLLGTKPWCRTAFQRCCHGSGSHGLAIILAITGKWTSTGAGEPEMVALGSGTSGGGGEWFVLALSPASFPLRVVNT